MGKLNPSFFREVSLSTGSYCQFLCVGQDMKQI